MPRYKLIYFDARGRGELIRQVFVLAGHEYEDYRMSREEWTVFQRETPFSQLPILQEDGRTVLAQSLSIARYLARKFELAGDTDHEQAWADMVVDGTQDITKAIARIYYCTAESYKEELRKSFQTQELPHMLTKFEKLLSDNESGFFVGNKITWCDLAFVIGLSLTEFVNVDFELESYPHIAAHKSKVENNPRIKEWLMKRPVTFD